MQISFIKTALAKTLEDTYLHADGSGVNFTPKRMADGAVGYDVFACTDKPVTIFPGQSEKISTGVKIHIESYRREYFFEDGVNMAVLILPRSSVKGGMLKNTVGVVDTDYQGEWFVKLFNNTDESITIGVGERFAQIMFVPVFLPELVQVEGFNFVTERGEGGFGSTNRPVAEEQARSFN